MLLLNDDCLSSLKNIPDCSVDMALCDLPFGVTVCPWDKALPLDQLWAELHRVCKENAAVVMFASNKFTYELVNSNFKEYRYKYIWVKNHASGFLNANRMPLRAFEEICVFYRKLPTFNPIMKLGCRPISRTRSKSQGHCYQQHQKITYSSDGRRYPLDVLHFDVVLNGNSKRIKLHPSEKPVDLLEYLIKTYTNPGEVVLDPTMGVGSTGVAAVNTGRDFIGIELDPTFFATAKQRIQAPSLLKGQEVLDTRISDGSETAYLLSF